MGLLFIFLAKDVFCGIYATIRQTFFYIKFSKFEWLLFFTIIMLILFYLYRSGIPWVEHDEMAVYGFLSKLIANGWSYEDVLNGWRWTVHSGPKMTESLDAQLFMLLNDPFLVRFSRFIGLMACSLGIFSFLRFFNVRRLWSLFAVAIFLSTPEICLLGLFLKVDAVIMSYELCALMNLTVAIWGYRYHPVKERERIVLPFAVTALILSFSSFGSRKSGLYIALFATLIFLWLSFQAYRKKSYFPRWALTGSLG